MLRLLAVILLPAPMIASAADVSRAPLPVMQSNPAMLRYLDPQPSTAAALGAGKLQWMLNQHYSSIFLADALPVAGRYLADMEIYVIDSGLRYGLTSHADIEIHLPVLRSLGGGLDSFLHHYHKALGLPNGGRESRPADQFAYFYQGVAGGWTGRSGWQPGNVRVKAKQQLGDKFPLLSGYAQLALQLEAQLPTASRSLGWSHGGADAAAGMVASWQSGSAFSHLEAWWVHPFKRNDSGSPVRDYGRAAWTGGYAVHLRHVPLNLIVQIQGGSSPYQTGVAALDASPWLISFGFRTVDPGGRQWSLAFIENISQQSTQDFGMMLGLSLLQI